jgi:hypothetical protein
MHKGRLEAFSDGVIAIITIMVMEIKVPHGNGAADWPALWKLLPVFLSYVLSFVYEGTIGTITTTSSRRCTAPTEPSCDRASRGPIPTCSSGSPCCPSPVAGWGKITSP